jgi:thioredoxin-like negative regulator of GroEL
MLSPILETVADDADVDLVTIDTDEHTSLAQSYQVRAARPTHSKHIVLINMPNEQVSALPTVVAFRGGEPVKRFVGVLPEGGVRKFLKEV